MGKKYFFSSFYSQVQKKVFYFYYLNKIWTESVTKFFKISIQRNEANLSLNLILRILPEYFINATDFFSKWAESKKGHQRSGSL